MNGGVDNVLQEFDAKNGHLHGSTVYWNSPDAGPSVYMWSEYDHGKRYQLRNSAGQGQPAVWRYNTSPVSQTSYPAPDGMPGGMLTLSANGARAGTGILWVNMPLADNANQATVAGVIRAFDASDLTHELWNSQMIPARDSVGMFGKFAPVTVANGRVYAATFSNKIVVYGILPYPKYVPIQR
jgi:hypothetical protein